MTREMRKFIYWKFRNFQKIAVGIVVGTNHAIIASIDNSDVKRLTFQQIRSRKIAVINVRAPDEVLFVNREIQTISLRVICSICFGGPLADWEYDHIFFRMSRFWYSSLQDEVLSELSAKTIVKRLSISLKDMKSFISEAGCKLQFLLELELVPILHSMYLKEAFPVDLDGIAAEIASMLEEKGAIEDAMVALSNSHVQDDVKTVSELKKSGQRKQKIEKILTQFPISKFRNDGIRCKVNSIGTETFRMSTCDMNLYGLPRRFRKHLQPRVGDVLLTLDIHAAQLIILAWLAGETKLILLYEAGDDVYLQMGSRFFDKPVTDITETERSAIKRVILLLINGGGIDAMRTELEGYNVLKTKAEVISMKHALFKYLPNIKNYIQKLESAESLCLLSGRIWSSDLVPAPHKRLSRVLQGIESEILKLSLVKISRKLSGCEKSVLYMTLHDSITVETIGSEKEKVKKIVCESVNEIFRIYFPNAKKIILKEEKKYE